MGFAVTSYSPYVVGILSARVASNKELLDLNSNQTTLGVNQERYSAILKPCEVLDGKVIDYLNDITSNKTNIVNLGSISNFYSYPKYYATKSAADSATQSIFGNTLTSREVMTNLSFNALDIQSSATISAGTLITSGAGGSGIVAITTTTSVGVAFSMIVKSVTGAFGIGSTIYLGNPGVAFTSLSSFDYVGTGKIYPDHVIVTYYPDLEPSNSSVDNPFEDEQFKVLNNPIKGLGVANTFYSNSLTNGVIVNSNDPITQIGDVFAFDTVSGSSVKTTIDNLIVDLSSNRTGIASVNSDTSIIKSYKKGYSVNIWSLNKTNKDIQSDITSLEAAINILSKPENGGPY